VDRILEILLKHLSFLYNECGFNFVESKVGKTFGSDAYLILSSDTLRLRFVSDRAQLFLDFQSIKCDKENDWHSMDVVKELLTNDVPSSSVLSDEYINFLVANFEQICGMFSVDNACHTIEKIYNLEKKITRDMFTGKGDVTI